jgi:hypothetical protein
MTNEPTPAPFGVFHDVATGKVVIRDLTPEEIEALPDFEKLGISDETLGTD